ncbi:MAG: flagellar M-ring protein FliF [Acidobacteriota bacterium]|jgi:flagellar M-ring protein FliF|nr:flagellar M-ring protein FliF [Acidobacteriota bacterium]
MAANRPNFMNQLLEMWQRLQWRQRGTIIAFAVLGVALICSVVYFMNRVEYQTLYRDLDPEDAQAIAAKLEEDKRDFRVKGTSILVAAPKEEIDKMRLEISGAGLGRSGRIGYEIFDKNQFGMTDFTEQINLQRALEGELSRTITSLSEISQARVHIVLPKDSYFEESRENAKASVVLSLKKGATLSKSSIEGIKGVVAGAVPGLSTHNVSIVDDEGRVLAQSMDSSDMARAERESGVRDQMEKDMVGKVVDILEPLVGAKNVRAKASIEMDFNTMEQTEETYNPNPPAVLSHQRSEERIGGASIGAGIPGTQSNVGTAAPVEAATTTPERVRESEVTNYEINKTVRHTVQPRGAVRRLSVAVILNDKVVAGKDKDGAVTTKRVALTEDELETCLGLVQAAVGYDEQRGDVVSVKNVSFFDEATVADDAPAGPWYVKLRRQEYFIPALKYVALLMLFVLAYFLLVRPLRNRVFQALDGAQPAALEDAGDKQLPPGEAVAGLPAGAAGADGAAAEAGKPASLPAAPETGESVLTMENATDEQIERELMMESDSAEKGNRRYAIIQKKLVEKAKKDPELVSQLIRSLMHGKA